MTTVYLDTHHLSRMASGKSQISRFLSDPAYTFVFSTSHVVECLPTEPRENPGSIAQLEIILNPHAKWLVGWGDLASIEKSHPVVHLNDLFCNKDQMLFSDFKIDRADWNKRVRESLKGVLKERIQDQNLRRSYQAKLLKHGKLTAEAFRMIGQQSQETWKATSNELPNVLPLLGKGGLYDFLQGNVSEEDFRARFIGSLGDPISLATMSSIPDLASILDLSRFFWSQMDELAEMLLKFIASAKSELSKNGGSNYAKGKDHIRRYLKNNEFRSALIRRFTGVEVATEQLSMMVGSRLFADIFSEYILEKFDQYVNPASKEADAEPKLKRSDAADFSHLFYYPYVDIFGCDGAMFNRIKKAGWPTDKVVTNDAELEARLIEIIPD